MPNWEQEQQSQTHIRHCTLYTSNQTEHPTIHVQTTSPLLSSQQVKLNLVNYMDEKGGKITSTVNLLRGHNMKLFHSRCGLLPQISCFSLPLIYHWNNLPQDVVEATSVLLTVSSRDLTDIRKIWPSKANELHSPSSFKFKTDWEWRPRLWTRLTQEL